LAYFLFYGAKRKNLSAGHRICAIAGVKRDHDSLPVIDARRVNRYAARSQAWRAGSQVELPGVQRADQRRAAHQTIR